MVIILSFIAVVLSLLLVVGVHEAGHAWAARLFKIRIKRISIGFGRSVLSWQGKNGCQWVWAIWPLGGYVFLLNTRIEPVDPSDYPFAFDKKPIWVRCSVLLSGACANLLMAWLALVFMLMLGYQQTAPVIATITTPSLASTAGLVAGDRITSIDGQPVLSWQDAGMQLLMTLGTKSVDVGVENVAGATHQVRLNLSQWRYSHGKESLFAAIGIAPDLSEKNKHQLVGLSWPKACQQAFFQVFHLLYFFLVLIKQLLTGAIPFSVLLGPIGLFTVLVSSFFQGLTVYLYFIANLSLTVALVNLLPIPILDGGSIIYTLVEKIRGKPVPLRTEILLHRLIFIAFCMILVQLLLNDLYRYMN